MSEDARSATETKRPAGPEWPIPVIPSTRPAKSEHPRQALQRSERIAADPALAATLDPLVERFAGKRIILVTTHRRENFGDGMAAIARAIARIAARDDVAILFPMHPNPTVGAVMDRWRGTPDNVARIAPLDYPHFIRALGWCDLALTDSGGVQEECAALGRPVLVMREDTERPEALEAGVAILVGTDTARIVETGAALLDNAERYRRMAQPSAAFGRGSASTQILDAISRFEAANAAST